jgi:ankyrin repeat protein
MTHQQLPPTPSLEYDKKQAKALLKAYQQGDSAALDRIQSNHPKIGHFSHLQLLEANFKLADAQVVIAREYGFSSWTKLKRHIQSLSPDFKNKLSLFKDAVRGGETENVRNLLENNADLRLVINEPLFDFDSQAIVVASSRQNISMVKVLLDYGADINITSEWWAGGFSALHGAEGSMAAFLIEHGATVDIHSACKLDMLEQIQALVEANPDMVNAKGGDGQRPLHYAKTTRIIDYLLENGADINARDIDHYATAAQWAINDKEKCRYLVDKGADVDIFMAIALGDAELVKKIMQESPDAINARIGDNNFGDNGSGGGHIYIYELGYTTRPLQLAGRKSNQAVIDVLLSYATHQQQFLLACVQGDESIAMTILRDDPDMVNNLPLAEQRIISDAAWERNIKGIRLMLKIGFDVDARGENNSTAVDRAAIRGYADVVALCIQHGASLTVKNEYGGTPLEAALWGSQHFRDWRGDYPATVEALLNAGAPAHPEMLPTGNNTIDVILQRYLENKKD